MRDNITSDHVIEGYLLAIESRPQWAHRYVLRRFLRRWPGHAPALLEHVALEAIISTAPDTYEPDPEAEERIVQSGMEVVRKLLEKRGEK